MQQNLVAVLDSGCANLGSIHKALLKAGVNAAVTGDPAVIAAAGGVVFPGVGAFGHAMRLLRERGLVELLQETVRSGKPFLGICLGMQLFFSQSEERGGTATAFPRGLDFIAGKVVRFPKGLAVPHVGWNEAVWCAAHPLLDGLAVGTHFYFTHSYYVEPLDPSVILTVTEYGRPFPSAIARGNLMGVQFHPEKSGSAGLRLLGNFGKIVADPKLVPAA